jgi:hypothetical protein
MSSHQYNFLHTSSPSQETPHFSDMQASGASVDPTQMDYSSYSVKNYSAFTVDYISSE